MMSDFIGWMLFAFITGAFVGMRFTFWRVNKKLDKLGIPR